jgi:hypothetical protein
MEVWKELMVQTVLSKVVTLVEGVALTVPMVVQLASPASKPVLTGGGGRGGACQEREAGGGGEGFRPGKR